MYGGTIRAVLGYIPLLCYGSSIVVGQQSVSCIICHPFTPIGASMHETIYGGTAWWGRMSRALKLLQTIYSIMHSASTRHQHRKPYISDTPTRDEKYQFADTFEIPSPARYGTHLSFLVETQSTRIFPNIKSKICSVRHLCSRSAYGVDETKWDEISRARLA